MHDAKTIGKMSSRRHGRTQGCCGNSAVFKGALSRPAGLNAAELRAKSSVAYKVWAIFRAAIIPVIVAVKLDAHAMRFYEMTVAGRRCAIFETE